MPMKQIRGGRPKAAARGVPLRRATVNRPARRAVTPKRVENRIVKRQQVIKRAANINPRPRPVVRPAAPPKKIMQRAAVRPAAVRPGAPPPRRASTVATARTIKQMAGTAAVGGGLIGLQTSGIPADLSADISSLQYSLNELAERASFADLDADVANLDANLNHALSLLESARDKGFHYQKDLEDIAYDAMSRWQKMRDEVQGNIRKNAQSMENTLSPLNQHITRLNGTLGNSSAALSAISSLRGEVDRAMNSVYDVERSISSAYDDIDRAASELTSRLTRVHWMLTQLEEASFEFEKDEDLYLAVKARWDYQGDDDPEGILYLTNKRLVFERKEKVATKKVLFITTAKELVQQMMIGQALANIAGVKAHNKGVFGNQDFIDVEFKDKKIGVIPFHLDGQDSEDWARAITNAQSGKIENERATGAGLSYKDLTGELNTADIVDLQNEVNELQDEMMLRATADELSELENEASTMSRELSDLRARNYAIEKSLEADVEVLSLQWEKIKQRADQTLQHQTGLLSEQMSAIQKQMAALAGMGAAAAGAHSAYIGIKSAIASAEAQAEAAQETVLDQYDEYADEVEALHAHFDWVDWMLDAISTASFKLLATESGVAAVEAVWERPGLDPENGVLFLTDQRFLWEDRVGDFELKFDAALKEVESVKTELDEEIGVETLLVSFSGNAPLTNARFVLAQPVGEQWQQMIGRAQSGDYVSDRAVAIDKEELERIRNAPEQCSNCGGAFTAPVLRGQTEITCEFCGTVTRI